MAKANGSKTAARVNSETVKKETKMAEQNDQATAASATAATETKAQKVIVITDLDAAVRELVTDGLLPANVQELVTAGLLTLKIDEVEVDEGKFSGDYVRIGLGANAKAEADVVRALVAMSAGNLLPPAKEDGSPDMRKPSLVKFALYGADLNARSRTSQRIKAAAEGPEKAIEKMADQIQKAKPGKYTREQAVDMARMVLGDDDETEAAAQA